MIEMGFFRLLPGSNPMYSDIIPFVQERYPFLLNVLMNVF